MAGEAARYFILVDAETGKAVSGLKDLDNQMTGAAKSGGVFGTAMGTALGFVSGSAIIGGIQAVGGAVLDLGKGMLQGAGQMERYETQLGVLLGSSKEAKKRLAELTEFAKTTPFELPQVIEASRTLQVFTKGALASGEGLRLVGDIAAGTGQDFNEVAMWMGRLYDALKSGRPFGDATMRLQEMGAMSGDARGRIEALAKQIKSGAIDMTKGWASVTGEFKQFAGLMDKQSATMEGQLSNLQDAIGQGLAKAGENLLPLAKKVIPLIIAAVDKLSQILGDVTRDIAQFVDENETFFKFLGDVIGATFAVIGAVIEELAARIGGVIMVIGGVIDGIAAAMEGDGKKLEAAMTKTMDGMAQVALGSSAPKILAQKQAEMVASSGKAMDDMVTITKDGMDDTTTAVAEGIGPVSGIVGSEMNATVQKAKAGAEDIAQALRGEWDSVKSDFKTLGENLKNEQSRASRIRELDAMLHSKRMREALNSNDPFVVADAMALREKLTNEMMTLSGKVDVYAQRTGSAVPDALAKYKDIAGNRAKALAGDVDARLAWLKGRAEWYGETTGKTYANGLEDSKSYLHDKAVSWLASLHGVIKASSPPKEGPLKDIDKDAYRTAQAWADGFAAYGPTLRKRVEDTLGVANTDLAVNASSGMDGGVRDVTVNIGDFHGTEENIADLARKLGEVVRYSSLRRAS